MVVAAEVTLRAGFAPFGLGLLAMLRYGHELPQQINLYIEDTTMLSKGSNSSPHVTFPITVGQSLNWTLPCDLPASRHVDIESGKQCLAAALPNQGL